MTIEHEKISGMANYAPGQVGGDDWDAPHVHAVGAVILVGFTKIGWQFGSNFTQNERYGSTVQPWARTDVGVWSAATVADVPVRAGASVKLLPVITSIQGLPANWTCSVSAGYIGQNPVVFEVFDSGAQPATPSQNFTAWIQTMAVIQ